MNNTMHAEIGCQDRGSHSHILFIVIRRQRAGSRRSGSLSVKAGTKLRCTLVNISRVRRTANFGVNTPIWRPILVLLVTSFNTFTTLCRW